jgi:hypothetical protein
VATGEDANAENESVLAWSEARDSGHRPVLKRRAHRVSRPAGHAGRNGDSPSGPLLMLMIYGYTDAYLLTH